MESEFRYDGGNPRTTIDQPPEFRTNMIYDTGPCQVEADRPVVVIDRVKRDGGEQE